MLDNNILLIICGIVLFAAIILLIYFVSKPKCIIENYDTGEKRYKYYVKNNKKVGTEKVYYRSGKLNKEKHYENGVINGETITYYESGARYIIATYNNGSLKGPYTVYEESGSIKESRVL